MTVESAFDKYRSFLEGLTVKRLDDLDKFVTKDVLFRDPFHDVRGTDNMVNIFMNLFEAVHDIQFQVICHAVNGSIVFYHWEFSGVITGRPRTIDGLTRLVFDQNEMVEEHVEYWDSASQLYEKMPLIGRLLRYCRWRISGGRLFHFH